MKHYNWRKAIRAIGWDLDGTLYHPDAIPRSLFRVEELGVVSRATGWPPDKVNREIGKFYEQTGSHTKALTALGIPGETFFTHLWDRLPLERFIKPDPHLKKMFQSLGNYRHFILSNSNTVPQIERKLLLLGLTTSTFAFLQSTVGMEAVKPEPRPFLLSLYRLGLPAREVLYVGDRVKTDVIGAHRVGMKAALVWRHNRAADVSFDTVYQVGDFFGNHVQFDY